MRGARHSVMAGTNPVAFARGILAEMFCVGLLGTFAFIALEAARWLGR